MKRGMREMGLRLGILTQYPPIPLRLPPVSAKNGDRKDLPAVSIVTPSFNQARFLEATVLSVLEQNYTSLEYSVMDGGSSDGSADILRRHGGRLNYWESVPDRGQANAINKGFARSTGSIMAWLNSDDLLLPGAVDHVASVFREHPEIDVVYGNRIIINETGDEVGRWILPPHTTAALFWRDYVPQETLFWRRSLWEKVDGHINEDFDFAIDWELLLRFQLAGARFARIPRFLGAFRTHAAQKTLARVEDVGRPEFERLQSKYGGSARQRMVHRLANAGYVASSMGYTWLYRAGLHSRNA
jgi:glycosyltransferase involved in cell wall biosynthesis